MRFLIELVVALIFIVVVVFLAGKSLGWPIVALVVVAVYFIAPPFPSEPTKTLRRR